MLRRLAPVAAVLALAAPASAHPGPPLTVDVKFSDDGQQIAVGMTWGLALSQDGGQTFHWQCELAIGYGGFWYPDYQWTPSGLMLANSPSLGLRTSRDACTWTPAPAPLGTEDPVESPRQVTQVEVGPDGAIYATTSTYDNNVYVSRDDAASFTPVAHPNPSVDWWESFIAAPTALPGGATRLYLTGYTTAVAPRPGGDPVYTWFLYRSDDGGASWDLLPLEQLVFGSYLSRLRLVAVDPDDPDELYARISLADGESIGDALYRSVDGGDSWTLIYTSTDALTGVVKRAGDQLVIAERGGAGDAVGVRVSDNLGDTWSEPITGTEILCLGEHADVLYACGDGLFNGMALGRADTAGDWTTIISYDDLAGILGCEDESPDRESCEREWAGNACNFGIDDPAVDCGGGAPDAGTGPEPVDPTPKGCGCQGSGPGGDLGGALALGLAALAVTRRRRRTS